MMTSRSEVRTPTTTVAASGRAGAAVSYAMAQVGDAYVYGAAGPDAYDCSGLTMASWAQAGVALPHSSSAQYSSGPQVPASALQPGDLVFYYSPISHVGMYIGNGMIVHAANPSTGVQVVGLYSMPFSGAVRPG
jgi:cell wall-associated NlpC family hydrolase